MVDRLIDIKEEDFCLRIPGEPLRGQINKTSTIDEDE